MYCIVYYGFGDKEYLAYQNTNDEIAYGYYTTDRDTFLMNLSNNKKDHPTLFKTEDDVFKFIDWLTSNRKLFHKDNFSYEPVYDTHRPKCDMECFKCNKKKKVMCKNLRNPYQNTCGFIMAKFEDGFKLDEHRLDAPCERCLTKGCPYNMTYHKWERGD